MQHREFSMQLSVLLLYNKQLAKRFYECLDSDAEKLFFKAYILFMKDAGKNIPALIPQVYLYYDPKIQSERELKIFEHQKMDFMMIIGPSQRVVIEIDGQQHYAEDVIALDLCQYFGQKKLKGHAVFLNSISSFC